MSLPGIARAARVIAAALGLLLLLVHAAPAAPGRTLIPGEGGPGRRVALVVGNGAYANTSTLANPPADVTAVAQALRGLGFEVIEARDLDYRAMLAILGRFADRLRGAEAGLFFYAGHGLQVAGENYLVPVDARLERAAYLDLEALPVQ